MQSTNSTNTQPIFNVPGIVVAFIGSFALVHAAQVWLLSSALNQALFVNFAFIPFRWSLENMARYDLPLNWWSLFSYSFLHANWIHMWVNAAWLLAFGSVVARRLGIIQFIVFALLTAIGGALAHLVTHWNETSPMIGASGIVSGCMGAAVRFAFPDGEQIISGRTFYPAVSLYETFQNKRVLAFVAVFFAINLVIGTGVLGISGGGNIAWQAHLGGFLAGLLLLPALDWIRKREG